MSKILDQSNISCTIINSDVEWCIDFVDSKKKRRFYIERIDRIILYPQISLFLKKFSEKESDLKIL